MRNALKPANALFNQFSASTEADSVQNNENIRDLTKLNRDLPNVIYLVTESKAGTVEPSDNVLVLPDYKPGGSDGGGVMPMSAACSCVLRASQSGLLFWFLLCAVRRALSSCV